MRRPPARSRRCASAARIATGFAFHESLISSPPPGSSVSWERQSENSTSTGSAGGSTPSASAAVSAAAAFVAWWRAVKPNTTSRPCQRTCVRPSRTSASGAPKRRTSSPSGTNGSSAGASSGRTATAPAGSSSSSSAFARAMFSRLPICSRWTGAMEVITPRSGRATRARSRIWPAPRIAISVTTTSVSGSIRHSVSGNPISLLKPRGAATVRR